MPFHLPLPEASIVLFFSEARRFLLENLTRRSWYPVNLARSNYFGDMYAFADYILPDTITLATLLQGLRDAGSSHDMTTDAESYIQLILDALWRYLSQVDVHGNNALMLATLNHPEALAPLLEAVNCLANPEHKAAILRQVNDVGYNLLMLATRLHSASIALLLDTVNNLANPVHKAAILRQVSDVGYNVLMLAARFYSASIALLLDTVNGLANPVHKAAILRQANFEGYNTLMMAAFNHPGAIAPLLEAINDLASPELMAAILSQINVDGNNALMIAVICYPQCVDSILSRISTLNSNQKVEILLTTNKEGKTVQDLVSGYHNGALHPSLASIKTAIDSMYSQPPQEGGMPVASSSSAASPAVASPFSFFPARTVHSPAPDSSGLELAHIEKLTGVKGWRVAGDKLTVEVLRHEKDTVIISLTDSPELDLSVRTNGGRSIISVNRSSQSPQATPDAPMPDPERKSDQPEDEIPDETPGGPR